jgi:hypothetical protein
MNPVHPRSFRLAARVALLAFTLALAGTANAQASLPEPPLTIAPPPAAAPVVAVAVQEATATATAPEAAPAASPEVPAAEPVPETFQALDTQVQDLKQDVLDLNRDLFMLEEELLFPANTQMAVFLSMDVSSFFQLDSVQLRLDDKQVANYLYTEREVDGLNRGGVQRLYLGNVKFGQHELVAFFTGKGPQDREYRRGATITFRKGEGAKFLELRVSDKQRALQPEFVIKEWE